MESWEQNPKLQETQFGASEVVKKIATNQISRVRLDEDSHSISGFIPFRCTCLHARACRPMTMIIA